MPVIRPGIHTMPRERRLSIAGIREEWMLLSTYRLTVVGGVAPRARAVSISPVWASTSARKRFSASPLVFIALAIIMLPTGMSEVMAVSITPAHVMMAVTAPAPTAIAHVDTFRAPGMFRARRA